MFTLSSAQKLIIQIMLRIFTHSPFYIDGQTIEGDVTEEKVVEFCKRTGKSIEEMYEECMFTYNLEILMSEFDYGHFCNLMTLNMFLNQHTPIGSFDLELKNIALLIMSDLIRGLDRSQIKANLLMVADIVDLIPSYAGVVREIIESKKDIYELCDKFMTKELLFWNKKFFPMRLTNPTLTVFDVTIVCIRANISLNELHQFSKDS